MEMNHTIEKFISIALLAIFLTASNLFALSPNPKTDPLPELCRVLKVIDGDTIDVLSHGQKRAYPVPEDQYP